MYKALLKSLHCLFDGSFSVQRNSGIVSIKITTDNGKMSADEASSVDSLSMITTSLKMAGCGLAAALCVLNNCPIHSRYVKRGTGKRQVFQVEQFVLNTVEVSPFMKQNLMGTFYFFCCSLVFPD